MRFPILIAALPLLALAGPLPSAAKATRQRANAAAPRALGGDTNWSAFAAGSGKTLVCYLVGKPVKSLPKHVERGRVQADVTHRPGEKTFYVVNFELGYKAKPGSSAELTIDGRRFDLFTAKGGAWTRNAATDKAVAMAMAKGREAIVKAVSDHNTTTLDTYSLDGFSHALALIDKACHVEP